jgi:hypothetical protein
MLADSIGTLADTIKARAANPAARLRFKDFTDLGLG